MPIYTDKVDAARKRNEARRYVQKHGTLNLPADLVEPGDWTKVIETSDRMESESLSLIYPDPPKPAARSKDSGDGGAPIALGIIVIAIVGWIISNIVTIATSLALVVGMLVTLWVAYRYLPEVIGSWRASRSESAMRRLDPNALAYKGEILHIVRGGVSAAEFQCFVDRHEELQGPVKASGLSADKLFRAMREKARSEYPDPVHRPGRYEDDFLDETPLKRLTGIYASLLVVLAFLRMAKEGSAKGDSAKIDAMVIGTLDLMRVIGISKRSAWFDAHPKNWRLNA